jgi:hypothetical protein
MMSVQLYTTSNKKEFIEGSKWSEVYDTFESLLLTRDSKAYENHNTQSAHTEISVINSGRLVWIGQLLW